MAPPTRQESQLPFYRGGQRGETTGPRYPSCQQRHLNRAPGLWLSPLPASPSPWVLLQHHPESSSLTPNWSPQGHSNPTPLTQAPHLLPSLRYKHTKPLINLVQTLSPPIPLVPFSVASGHSGLLGSRPTNYNLDCRTFKTLSPSSRPAHTAAAPSAQSSDGPDSLQLRALPRFPIKEEARMPEPGPPGFFWRFPGSGPTSLQHRLTHVSTSSNGPPWSPPTRLSHCCLRTFAHAGLPTRISSLLLTAYPSNFLLSRHGPSPNT